MLRAATIRTSKSGLACIFLAATLCGTTLVHARQPLQVDKLPTVSVAELPRQGRETYQLIRQGGPFPYDKDGGVFGNRERQLPAQRRGYYHEYTVKTPYARDRGARRIVCGGRVQAPDTCYYTGDHYASFRRIVE
ncbi:ribonuclease domain-containing protein [Rhodoferax sediminis]|uniref:Ribonuclease N n=1 Tax=Rhodoferax sediminis TaxID=2509614 RepID=A0A515D661_9BURK|nr:ribonuclease [Rhodoferax sediminis]QDL35881.1 ribonuclease N [Rhodoferax sediminis]